jgi:tryptophan synthase beta chain
VSESEKLVKVRLEESEIPTQWYNILADLPEQMPPPIHPGTKQPIGPDDLKAIFPMSLIAQEMSPERWIDIPEPVRDAYRLYRPTPLYRARRLEKALGTPAEIYYNYEGASPTGSHKSNTAIAQAYYNMLEGKKRLATETGAGQWGSALSLGCMMFGLKCTVYMVKVSYEQKPYRGAMMRLWGAEVFPSPTDRTQSGRNILEKDPDCLGSLGIAISEAVEDAATHDDTNYSLGSVLNHVCLHQSVVGLEAKKKMEKIDRYPDVVIGCCGGGSNFHGIMAPFYPDTREGKRVRFIGVEPTACPTMTRGLYTYDFGDTGQMTPLMKMHTLGHDFVPPGIHAGGLRYHGMAPITSLLVKTGVIEPMAFQQVEVFESARLFANNEAIVPAPESAHALHATIEEARRCAREKKSEVLLVNLSGHGHFDMGAYIAFLGGELVDYAYPEEKIKEAIAALPKVG